MEQSSNVERDSRISIGFEISDVIRYLLIVLVSFISTFVVASAVRSIVRNNIVLTILLATALFFSAFFAMRVAKAYLRSYFQKYGLLVIPPALAALFLLSSIKPVVFVLLFMLHGLACFFLKTLKNTARLGIELIMLITVLGSFVYGPKAGALLGAAAMLMDYALTARFSYFVPVTTAAYAFIGLIAGSFASAGITSVGVTATIIYNLATSFIIVAFMGGHIDKCLRFGLSNLALNFMLFTSIAPWLLSILT